MDTCVIDEWEAGYGHGGTGHPRGSHSLSVEYQVKRPKLRRASNKMSAPSRAPRIQYYHIVVFVRGAGGREKERRSEKLKSVETVVKGRRGDYLFDVRVKMAYVLYN